MLRLCVYDEVIEDPALAKVLLREISGLTMAWRRDLGELEQPPAFIEIAASYGETTVKLNSVPMGVHEVLWEKNQDMDQMVFSDRAIFWRGQVFPKGSGIAPMTKAELENMQVYMSGSGMRIIAYGMADDRSCRKYQPYRSSDRVPPNFKELPLLGQVDLETGEIWPLPQEAR